MSELTERLIAIRDHVRGGSWGQPLDDVPDALAEAVNALEAVERDSRIAEDDRRTLLEQANLLHDEIVKRDAIVAAIRKRWQQWDGSWVGDRRGESAALAMETIGAILDGEGEKCPTCGGTDREGGTLATMGPDEFGNYDTDDCPDGWHT